MEKDRDIAKIFDEKIKPALDEIFHLTTDIPDRNVAFSLFIVAYSNLAHISGHFSALNLNMEMGQIQRDVMSRQIIELFWSGYDEQLANQSNVGQATEKAKSFIERIMNDRTGN